MSSFSVGDRVKHSGHVIGKKRDYWNQCGREPMKSGAKAALEDAVKERGTVSAILPGDPSRGVSPGIEVKWDSGCVSRCLSYLIEKADDAGWETCAGRANMIPGKPCAICGATSHTRS